MSLLINELSEGIQGVPWTTAKQYFIIKYAMVLWLVALTSVSCSINIFMNTKLNLHYLPYIKSACMCIHAHLSTQRHVTNICKLTGNSLTFVSFLHSTAVPSYNSFKFRFTILKMNWLADNIKTHGSESRGQEEAACPRIFRSMRPLQWVIYIDGSSKYLKCCNSASIAVLLT